LVQRARPLLFSTAAPPALSDAIDASLTIVEEEPALRARLFDRAAYLRGRLQSHGFPMHKGRSQIVPVVVGDNERAVAIAAEVRASGFDVRAVRPPTVPSGTARLRLSVNTRVSEAELDACVVALVEAQERCHLCAASS
jgi:8-amino-7-oxononanoate synthase